MKDVDHSEVTDFTLGVLSYVIAEIAPSSFTVDSSHK